MAIDIPGTPVSSTNKTNHHDIAEILLKVASNTIPPPSFTHVECRYVYMYVDRIVIPLISTRVGNSN
jgi:hypothetical protein